jgi:predicted DNA-binding protein YlxM (UPF0122 family)
MNCEELIKYLSEYIDNDLSEALRADAQAHLANCHNCSVVLDTTRKTITLYKKHGEHSLTASRRQDLFEKLKSALDRREGCD